MKSLKVLIVDDDRDFADSLADLFRLEGHESEVARTGEEAVERIREQPYDVTFMDVRLPGRNGVQSFKTMREVRPDVAVYMMTGFSVESLLSEALSSGARGVLQKPLDIDRVLGMLQHLCVDAILLVDDDADYAEAVRDALVEQGYQVHVCRDGREAVEWARSGQIALVILDLRLPGLSGSEVYASLIESGRRLPAIVVTGYAEEEQQAIKRLRDLSVSHVLAKPHDPRVLLDAVDSLTRR